MLLNKHVIWFLKLNIRNQEGPKPAFTFRPIAMLVILWELFFSGSFWEPLINPGLLSTRCPSWLKHREIERFSGAKKYFSLIFFLSIKSSCEDFSKELKSKGVLDWSSAFCCLWRNKSMGGFYFMKKFCYCINKQIQAKMECLKLGLLTWFAIFVSHWQCNCFF